MIKISTPNFEPEKINLKSTISALQNFKKNEFEKKIDEISLENKNLNLSIFREFLTHKFDLSQIDEKILADFFRKIKKNGGEKILFFENKKISIAVGIGEKSATENFIESALQIFDAQNEDLKNFKKLAEKFAGILEKKMIRKNLILQNFLKLRKNY